MGYDLLTRRIQYPKSGVIVLSKAEKVYAEALRLFPHHIENGIIYQRRADLLRRLGPACYKEAAEIDKVALNFGGLESSTYHHFGDVLAGLSDYKQALNAYELVAKADPQNIQILQKQDSLVLPHLHLKRVPNYAVAIRHRYQSSG